jgi:stage V sporulation protein D (sporulation-specific penicillin-binding protein)
MRAKFVFFGLLAVAVFLSWRLYDVQMLHGPVYAKEALDQRSEDRDVFGRRGSILDRDGNVLVHSLPSESIYAVPHDLQDPDRAAAQLSAIVGKLDPATVSQLHDRTRWFVWIARKVPHEQAVRVNALNLAGVQLKEEETGRRVDGVGDMASNVLGFVGTDETGLDGAEYSFDSLLKGTSGEVSIETDEFGRPIPFGIETTIKAPQPGLSIELTLDSYLQFVTEQALDTQAKAFHAANGTAIVMDPQTGEILALANWPTFDPNKFWAYTDNQRRDRAVMDAYEPGSTYKLVTAAAAIESHKVNVNSLFPARSSIQVGGDTIHNAEDGMPISSSMETLGQIIMYSHNVGAAEVGMSIGGRTFYAMERKAGFGDPTQVGLPGENPGIVPAPADWSGSSLATMSFGQGVSVTPLAMARYYCAIANGGILMRPRILKAIVDQDGNVVYQYEPEIEHRVFSERTAAILRKFLRAVVTGGTGDPSAQIAGYTTAGKTGTAQIERNGVYQPGAYAASFIGMVPYEHPRFVIFVMLERPIGSYYGSVVAAPAFTTIARAAMLHIGALPTTPAPAPTPAPKIVRKHG